MNEPQSQDIRVAARLCRETLEPLAGGDWTVQAGTLEWSARYTLEHVSGALTSYAMHLAMRATHRLSYSRAIDASLSISTLLTDMEARAAVLAEVVAAAPATARGFHVLGMADPSGFAAMACDEILIHTDDIARGFSRSFQPPGDLCRSVLARLFPWAPSADEPWAALRWANGRTALPDRDQLGPNWSWQCAPLSEWDGIITHVAKP